MTLQVVDLERFRRPQPKTFAEEVREIGLEAFQLAEISGDKTARNLAAQLIGMACVKIRKERGL